MLTNGWRKHFIDGTSYTASDEEVEQRLKSWRNSRQEDIIQIDVTDNRVGTAIIRGTGEFWQEDDLIAPLSFAGSTKGITVVRRIMKKIHSKDAFVRVQRTSNLISCEFSAYNPNNLSGRPISSGDIGKWFVVELDLQKKRFHWYLKE